MYTSPHDAIAEIARRRRDKGLMKAVTEYLDGPPPDGWPVEHAIATINRYLATARVEDLVFALSARSLGLRPFWPSYKAEAFTVTNPEKVSYLRPRIHRARMQITRGWLVSNHQQLQGVPLGVIQINSFDLPTVHAAVRERVLEKDVLSNHFDVSEWNRRQALRFGAAQGDGRLAPYYYKAVLALYLCHGILFEDFDGGPNAGTGLDRFVSETVKPAFECVTKIFRRQPLIVRLPYIEGFLDFPAAAAEVFDQHQETR